MAGHILQAPVDCTGIRQESCTHETFSCAILHWANANEMPGWNSNTEYIGKCSHST